MTECEYRQHPAISRSELARMKDSPEKFKYFKDNPEPPSPSLIFGQVFHKLALQPESFEEEFTVAPNVDRRTKVGKETWELFQDEAGDKTIITADALELASEMRDKLFKAPYVKKLLSGECEKPYFWTDGLTGEECKCRIDCITEVGGKHIIVDLKTTENAENDAFMKHSVTYGYDLQAAMYQEAVKQCTGETCDFLFIAIEKKPPYAVNILQADKGFLLRGFDLFREYLGTYHHCKEINNFYGYLGEQNIINNLPLPAYLAKEVL